MTLHVVRLTLCVLALLLGLECTAAGQKTTTLSVDAARPVMNAVVTLEQRYGWIVTYEDPPYAYSEDLQDRTVVAGSKRRALAPKGGRLEVLGLPGSSESADPAALVNRVLDAHAASHAGERTFRVIRSSQMLHVVPMRLRDPEGEWKPIRPVLDAAVTIPQQSMTLQAFVDALSQQLTSTTGVPVATGVVPYHLFTETKVTIAASKEPARDVLVRALNASGARLSWLLLYDAFDRKYVLNIGPPGNPGLVVK